MKRFPSRKTLEQLFSAASVVITLYGEDSMIIACNISG